MPDDRILAFDSPLGESCVATRLSGEERVNDLYSFSVTVASSEPIPPEKILGEEVTVTIRQTSDKVRPVFGIVSRIDQVDPVGDNRYEYNLEIVPPLWLLDLGAHTRIFTEKKTTDIVKQVISDGCTQTIDVGKVSKPCKPRETCAQYNESDLEFVLRLLAEDGISFFFEHSSGSVKMVLVDSASGFPRCTPHAYEYRGRQSSETLLCVSSFRRSGRLASASLESFDYSEYSAPNSRSFKDQSTVKGKQRHGVVQRHGGQYFERKGNGRELDSGDSKQRVRAWLDGMEADAECFTGESSWPTLIPGHKMKLNTKPAVADDTEFLLLEVLHEATEGVEVDSFYSNYLRCAPVSNTVAFRPNSPSPPPRIWGVHTATVVEVRPIPADGVHAEVKVRFPWDSEGISCWARVAQLYAGNKWGGYFVPELDQEVLVEFISGNPDRPVVVGAVYNSNNPIPPYNKWQSGIRTRSGSYNELLFTDEPGNEVFYTEAGKDYQFLVHNDQTGTVENDRSVEIQRNDSLTVGGDRAVEIEGGEQTQVKGDREVIVDGAMDTTVTKDYSLTIKSGDYSAILNSGDYSVKVKAGKHSIDAMKEMKLKVGASSITLKPSSIELKMGGSSIKLSPAGVDIKGVKITVDGSAMTQVKGGGMVQVQGGIVKIN